METTEGLRCRSPLPWDEGRRSVRAVSANAVGPDEYIAKHEARSSPALVAPLQPVTPPGPGGYMPLTPPETIQPTMLTRSAPNVGAPQPSPPSKINSSPGLSSVEGLDSEDSGDGEGVANKKKKLKKFLSKLKFSAKDKGQVTVPQPQV